MSTTIQVAIGPQLPEFGSWRWLGEGLAENLGDPFAVKLFTDPGHPPAADIVVYLKFLPPASQLTAIARDARLVYLPVDIFGSCEEIDRAFPSLQRIDKVLVHSYRLLRYFRGYCDVDYLDHPLKYILPEARETDEDGPILWIGQKCNIQPVVEWANSETLEKEFWVLTNLEDADETCESLGFRQSHVRVEAWSEQRHLDFLKVASVALDIKGNHFRARHKPPAKALDFLASGVPLITNWGSSVDLHLRHLSLQPLFVDSWRAALTIDYRKGILKTAKRLRTMLAPQTVWQQMAEVLHKLVSP